PPPPWPHPDGRHHARSPRAAPARPRRPDPRPTKSTQRRRPLSPSDNATESGERHTTWRRLGRLPAPRAGHYLCPLGPLRPLDSYVADPCGALWRRLHRSTPATIELEKVRSRPQRPGGSGPEPARRESPARPERSAHRRATTAVYRSASRTTTGRVHTRPQQW